MTIKTSLPCGIVIVDTRRHHSHHPHQHDHHNAHTCHRHGSSSAFQTLGGVIKHTSSSVLTVRQYRRSSSGGLRPHPTLKVSVLFWSLARQHEVHAQRKCMHKCPSSFSRLTALHLSIRIKMATHTHTCTCANMAIVITRPALLSAIMLYKNTCMHGNGLSMPKCLCQRLLVVLGTTVESRRRTPSKAGPLRWCCPVSNLQVLFCVTKQHPRQPSKVC